LDSIDIKPGDTVVDCGANVGDLELYFRFNNLNVNYIGFEPSPREFDCLRNNISQGTAFNMGLWDSDGSIPFYVSIENSDGSFIEPPVYTEVRKIKIARLDSLITQRIRFLKVEAEGGEPEVIRGCERILSNIEWISVDVGFERGVGKESTLVDVTNYLLGKNFSLENFIAPSGRWTALFRNNALSASS
jgi:FkbM family methyltransferase